MKEDVALAAIRIRITKVYPAQIRTAIETLTDEQLWWRPNEASNSIANLMLHLTGSLNHYLNRGHGGVPYDRNREVEFSERRMMPKAEVLALFDDMVANAAKTFESITVERLDDPSPDLKLSRTVFEDLINILAHISTHTGQILFIAKMLVGGAIDDLWISSHREQGAWNL